MIKVTQTLSDEHLVSHDCKRNHWVVTVSEGTEVEIDFWYDIGNEENKQEALKLANVLCNHLNKRL